MSLRVNSRGRCRHSGLLIILACRPVQLEVDNDLGRAERISDNVKFGPRVFNFDVHFQAVVATVGSCRPTRNAPTAPP